MAEKRVIDQMSRGDRRRTLTEEARNRAIGNWGPWEKLTFPRGTAGPSCWAYEITTAYRNKVFSVLVRDAGGGVTHFAVGSLSGDRPSWPEMQRIKDELAGPEKTAVEVYPPNAEIIDQAPMYHIWVLPEALPFSLHPRTEAAHA